MISEFERHWVDSCLSNSPLSCIILDVDYFKKINDQLGHVIGDKVLRRIANRIRSHARPGDCVARYGGEEFCVILVDADEDVAQAWAEQVRAELADWTFQLGDQQIGVTASFGAAQRNARTTTIEQLINAADHALLNAKETGRNRVVTSRSLKAKQGVYVTKSIVNFDALTVCPVI
ncbi:diguanylate cyclase (GGDEF)-like protein [Rhodopirellula rubra]|uniref:diguanylate cyclase n=2 Tax=Aporhodopirellula rubra TaxID=980271 RepID=A0A7W5H5J4_9BACT|nr:diguanylate cyclase (GGDEF)-like protein [Aporhodopirellula rubra]